MIYSYLIYIFTFIFVYLYIYFFLFLSPLFIQVAWGWYDHQKILFLFLCPANNLYCASMLSFTTGPLRNLLFLPHVNHTASSVIDRSPSHSLGACKSFFDLPTSHFDDIILYSSYTYLIRNECAIHQLHSYKTSFGNPNYISCTHCILFSCLGKLYFWSLCFYGVGYKPLIVHIIFSSSFKNCLSIAN